MEGRATVKGPVELQNGLKDPQRRNIQQYLVDHGVNQKSACSAANNDLRNWTPTELSGVFDRIDPVDSDLRSLDTNWLHAFLDIIADWTNSDLYWTKAPAHLIERSAEEGLALCINIQGEWSLREKGYMCISHVWEEGIRADTKNNRGLPTHRVKQVFERIAYVRPMWIWLDGLAIPGGSLALKLKEEEQKTAIINSLASIYDKSDAVIIFDALTMHLHSEDPVAAAVALVCGKWMTRVWTWQEIKTAKKAVVVTADGIIDFKLIFDKLRISAGVDLDLERASRDSVEDQKYYGLFMSIARLLRDDSRGVSLPDIALASGNRVTGNDIDYARAYFPVLGLKWRTGLTREEGMMMIYDCQRYHASRLMLMHGSPRTTIFPGWAPSFLIGLEGVILEGIPWRSRGLQRSWHTHKISKCLETQKPNALLLALESFSENGTLCGCEISKGESEATLSGITKAIEQGTAFLLSNEPLYPIKIWAKNAILVERVDLDNDDEAYVYLTVAVTVIQEHSMAWEANWLLRHESPISDHLLSGKGIADLRLALGHDEDHGNHKLIDAARKGDEKAVRAFATIKTELHDRDEKGWTALHAAAVEGWVKVVSILLEPGVGISVDTTDKIGRTALYLAVENGHDDTVTALIAAKANINLSPPDALMSVLDQAVKYNRPSLLQLLLSNGADPNKRNGIGFPPLMMASDQPEMIGLLLAAGADPGIIHSSGTSVLHFAARKGNVEVLMQLLDWGMNVNMCERGGLRNPLNLAIEEQHEDAVALLLHHGADPNSVYDANWTPLLLGAKKGNFKICQMLIQASAKFNERCSPEGWTALHIAAMGGYRVIVKLLVEAGADLGLRDSGENTALDLAVINGNDSAAYVLRGG